MRSGIQGILALLAAVHLQFGLYAQTSFEHSTAFKFEKLGAEEGLQSITPTDIFQDSKGFIWVSSFDGLYKYDGYTFTQFRHSFSNPNSVSKNHVRTIFEDSKGRLWLSIWEDGINLLVSPGDSIIRFDELNNSATTPPSLINVFEEDPDGNIWVGSEDRLYILQETGSGEFAAIEPQSVIPGFPDTLKSGEIRSMFLDSKQRFWIGHESGIYMYAWESGELVVPQQQNGFPPAFVDEIGTDRKGRIWISTHTYEQTRMWFFDEESTRFKSFKAFPFLNNTRWIQFCFDKDNRLWASEFGNRLYVLDPDTGEILLNLNRDSRPGYRIEEAFLRNPFCDASGNVWFCGHGLYKMVYPKGFQNYQHPFAFRQVFRGIYVSDKYFWLGVLTHGLARVDRETGASELITFEPITMESSSNLIFDILPLDENRLLLSGFGTLRVYDITTGTIISNYPISFSPARDIFRDSKERIWVASFGGLYQLNPDTGISLVVDPDQIKVIVEDQSGNLWLGGRYLSRYNPESGHIQRVNKVNLGSDSLPVSFLNDMVIVSDTLWIGMNEGLIAYDLTMEKGQFYHEDHGIGNAHVMSVLNDHNDRIWVATSSGIASFDRREQRFISYSKGDGLINSTYSYGSKYVDEQGRIYFGGFDGVDFFHPDKLRKNVFQGTLVLTNHSVLDEKAHYDPMTHTFTLSPKNILTELTVSAMHYGTPESVEYLYSVTGLQEAWVSLGHDRVVRLPHLPYGDYTLRIKATNVDRDWTTSALAIPIIVKPAYFETTGFKLSLILIALLAGFGILKNVSRKRKEKLYQKTINYFAHSHYGENSVDEVLWDVARNVISRLDFEDCVVYLLNPGTNMLQQKAAYGPKNPRGIEIIDPIEIPLGKGIVGSVALTGKGEIVHDTRIDPRYIVDDKARLSEIAVPILYEGKTIGVIDAESSVKGFFTQRHLSILSEITSYCAEKIVKAQVQTEARENERQLKEVQAEMAKLEKRALLAQMNPHFIFNAMNSIQHFITENDQESALRYLNKFSRLIREVLNIASEDRITLARELQFLSDYVSLEQLRFQNRFTFQMDIDKSIEPMVIEIPAFILQPHIENAILHGFAVQEDGGRLELHMTKNSHKTIIIEISDNGMGRQKAAELRLRSHNKSHQPKGISLIKERFRILSKQNPAYSMHIEDLLRPDGAAAGTKVVITIPEES